MAFRTPQTTVGELPPTGMQLGILVRITDLGTQMNQRSNKLQRKVVLTWELCKHAMKTGKLAGQPFLIHQRYTLSHHEKSALRKDLESWYGKSFNTEDLNKAGGFDLEKLLLRPAYMNLVLSEDRQYVNLGSINPVPKELEIPDVQSITWVFNLNEFDQNVYEQLSDGMCQIIEQSQEWHDMHGNGHDDDGPEMDGIVPARTAAEYPIDDDSPY